MRILSQLDHEWANLHIGNTSFTLGRWGCTITSICMLDSSFYPQYITPPEAAKQWSFNDQGCILWTKCNFKGFIFEWRGYGYDKKRIKEYAMDSDKGVILEVNNSHWVAVESWNVASDKPAINDPFGGVHYNLIPAKYKITGFALFSKTSKEMPSAIEGKPEAAEYAKEAIRKSIDAGVITNWSNPQEVVSNSKIALIFYKAKIFKELKSELTLQDLAVGLDNCKVFDKLI